MHQLLTNFKPIKVTHHLLQGALTLIIVFPIFWLWVLNEDYSRSASCELSFGVCVDHIFSCCVCVCVCVCVLSYYVYLRSELRVVMSVTVDFRIKNDLRFVFTCVCFRIVMSNTYCVVFQFCFSSSFVHCVASFSVLSICYSPFALRYSLTFN